ncbi:MAG: hypothetical protein JWN15_4176 [Firmicutes bacterium]|nr:hypothetical protein [Bacillota bacterium]
MGLPRSLQILQELRGWTIMTRYRKAILMLAIVSALLLDATVTFADHGGIVEAQPSTSSSLAPY